MQTELRFDWYEATLECQTETILALAVIIGDEEDPPTIEYGKGRNGYKRAIKISYPTSGETLTVQDLHQSGWPHLQGTGHSASLARRIALALNVTGRVSRIDIACDSLEGWWPAAARVIEYAETHPNTVITNHGDFVRGTRGRTYYVGAPTSEKRIRVYEKGIQMGGDVKWIRVEYQYRPANRAAMVWTFEASIEQIANSSRAFLALRALDGFYTPPLYERPAREPIIALARQYGRALKREVPDAYWAIRLYLKDWTPDHVACDSDSVDSDDTGTLF